MPDDRLIVEFKNVRPVELLDLTLSLASLAEQYNRFAAANDDTGVEQEARLYVRELRMGSIIVDLAPIAPLALPYLSQINTVLTFGKYLKAGFHSLLKRTKDPSDPKLEKADYRNFKGILQPVVKDEGSQINIGTLTINNLVVLDSLQASIAQEAANRELDALREPVLRHYKQVLLYWYQTRADSHSKAGDRGVIESIASLPVKVMVLDAALKTEMLRSKDNPFHRVYVVDVDVETVESRPALYKVTSFYESFDKPFSS